MANHIWHPRQPLPRPRPQPPRPNMPLQYGPSSSGAPVRASIPRAPFMNHRRPAFHHDFAPTRPETMPLPNDACNCLYVIGLPEDCSKRETAHIFRPFKGYRRVRFTVKKSVHIDANRIPICFVDFENSSNAATAMMALQGYVMDEQNPRSKSLELHFARHPARFWYS